MRLTANEVGVLKPLGGSNPLDSATNNLPGVTAPGVYKVGFDQVNCQGCLEISTKKYQLQKPGKLSFRFVSPLRGLQTPIGKPDPKLALICFPNGVCSSTDRASDYGSEGWGFESLQAHESPVSSHENRVFHFFTRNTIRFFDV